LLTARDGCTPNSLLEALDEVFEQVVGEAISEDELERARACIELSALQGLDTVGGKAEQVGFFETVLGDPGALFRRLSENQRVTRSDVLRVARRYLRRSARTVVEVLSEA